MTGSKKAVAIYGFAAICGLFVAVRFWRLGDSCLWFDEMFSVQAAEMPWSDMLGFLARDLVHPPLFYALLKLWIGLGGTDVFWLRSLPVLLACLSIIPFVMLCRELKQSLPVTLLSLSLLAVNGSLIKYAQEVRMYTLLMLVSLASMWLFARFFYRGKSFAGLVAVNIVAVYVHYYAWAFVGCEVLAILILQREKLGKMLLMAGGVFAAFVPWAYIVLSAARAGELDENIAWVKRPGFRVLFDYLFDLTEPFFFQTSSAEPASIYAITLPILILIFVAGFAWAVARKGDQQQQRATTFFLIFSPVVVAVVFIASWVLPYSVWGTRHLIIIVAPLMLLIANTFWAVRSVIVRAGLIGSMIVLVGVAGLLAVRREVPQYVWCGWEPLVGGLRASNADPEPMPIYASETLAAYHAWFANRDTARFRINVVKAPEGEFVDKEYFLPRGFNAVGTVELSDVHEPRIAIIYRRERPALTEWLRLRLEANGYAACTPTSVEFGQSTIVWMEMTRGVPGCVY